MTKKMNNYKCQIKKGVKEDHRDLVGKNLVNNSVKDGLSSNTPWDEPLASEFR